MIVKLYSARVFIKFDIIIAFNKIRIKIEEEEKTAFLTRYRIYNYIV